MNEWIDINYKSIPSTGKFIALNKDYDQAIVWYEGCNLIRGSWFGGCEHGCGGYDFFDNITHWMPLPESPKKKHRCKKFGIECFLDGESLKLLVFNSINSVEVYVDFCPICGEKA